MGALKWVGFAPNFSSVKKRPVHFKMYLVEIIVFYNRLCKIDSRAVEIRYRAKYAIVRDALITDTERKIRIETTAFYVFQERLITARNGKIQIYGLVINFSRPLDYFNPKIL